MIDIPEETLLTELSELLMNELPKILLEIEEQSDDSIRLPSFRYVGTHAKLPTGTGLPYALLEIDEVTYTTKDRIIKNRIYNIQLTVKLADTSSIWRYHAAIKKVIEQNSIQSNQFSIEKISKTATITLQVKK